MRLQWAVIPAIALALIGASASRTANPSKEGKRALVDLENRWVAALAMGDTKTINAILSDAFIDTDEDGNQTDRHGVLASVRSGEMKVAAMKLSGVHVRMYGDMGVVTGLAAQSGAYRGESLIPKVAFTDTFILQDGQWRAVASHRSALRPR
jgi:hypothetical protein